jgi:hypothetical protein
MRNTAIACSGASGISSWRRREVARDAHPLLEAARLPFERGDDALVEDARTQVVHDPRARQDRGVDQLADARERRGEAPRRLERVAQERELELDGGERAADVVVDLARDRLALLLAHARLVRRERAQLSREARNSASACFCGVMSATMPSQTTRVRTKVRALAETSIQRRPRRPALTRPTQCRSVPSAAAAPQRAAQRGGVGAGSCASSAPGSS